MQRISITIPEDIAILFNKKVAKGERSNFIARALKEALLKEGKWQSFEAVRDFKPFEVSKDSTEVLAEIRNKIQKPLN